MKFFSGLWTRFAIFRMVMKNGKLPFWTKIILGLALTYLLVPLDFISDFIPLLGQLDDIAIIPVLVIMAWKLIPPSLIEKYRKSVTEQKGKQN